MAAETLGFPSPALWGTRPALLEEINEGLKGKHKMSLMVLMKAPGLAHLTTHCAFPSNLPWSPQLSENCLVWTRLSLWLLALLDRGRALLLGENLS